MTNVNTFQGDVFIHEYIKHTGDDNNLFGFSGTDTFKIATAGTDRLTVTSSGNVGIGTTDPGTALDVLGTIRMTTGTNDATGGEFSIDTNVGHIRRKVAGNGVSLTSYDDFYFYVNATGGSAEGGTQAMSITNGGLVAIGNHAPNRTLDVDGSCTFRSIVYGERFTSYYHNTGQINSARNYDIALYQFQRTSTLDGHSPTTGWYLLSAQRGDGNPFEAASAHFYYYPSQPAHITRFGESGIYFQAITGAIRMVTSSNAQSFPTPYAIHLTKIGNTYAMGV
jgi:hypothetical protein